MSHKCPCPVCECGDDCKCAPGAPGCDACGTFAKDKAAAAAATCGKDAKDKAAAAAEAAATCGKECSEAAKPLLITVPVGNNPARIRFALAGFRLAPKRTNSFVSRAKARSITEAWGA